ncbi:MATE family efflux transporter [Fulvimonas soli]|jgi:MATE family multidrug resistance protein|uniref:Multidrug-efflux transporter n=1 Tax=Fulvimonas soli TaxID=155197 RepID=A0A316HYW0_9GAMM|nr:MATE family efflux transporter [Fulvimonas soli]PWK85950.1 MATE family multidrug resistance protein [Fulvimonas soli]TNY26699.1 MATE family efflux transporter [Fulvimonas soli]
MALLPSIDRARVAREAGATVRLALPLVLAQLAAVGTNFVDAVLSGHVGAHVLGAVAVGTNLWSLAIVTGIGVMMSVPPSVAQLDGAGRRHEVGAVFRQALWLALALGVLLWFGVRHAEPLIELIGVAPGLRRDVGEFLHAISWGAPALTCYFALRGLSEGLSLTRPSMVFSLGGLAVLAPLGYVFMFGKLGLPPQGARGCGIATASVLWLEMLGFAAFVLRHRSYRGLDLAARFEWPDLRRIGALLHVGLPMAVTLLAEAGLFVATGLLIATLGEDTVASHQVAINVASLFFMIPLGLAMAITVRVGNAVGRGDARGVRYAGFCGIALTLLTQAVSAALMLGLPHAIASLYTRDAGVIALAARLLLLAGLFQFSDGIQVASNGALRGLKDTRVPMAITLFAYWGVGMPLAWWLAFRHGLGARGMWMGLIAGLSVAALLLFARFWRSAWRRRWKAPAAADMTASAEAATLSSHF